MFKLNAPYSTTHILARDYARRTIDIVLIHHSDLLTDNEKLRIKPPYTDGGIREWGESEDGDAGPYQTGAAPIQMDFGNYTLGSLVKDRGSYNFEHPEYKQVRANIFWRIYDLGFSLDSFRDIDSSLGGENYRKYGRSANGGKTDRYGKKYSWIAFYELAGFRQDKGLLPEYYSKERSLAIDIDPSFPDEERRYNLVTEDFLGDRGVSAEEWTSNPSPPDLTTYLKVDHLFSEQGPWVLLNGYLSQKDDHIDREIFAFLRGLIVKSEEVEGMIETLGQIKISISSLPLCPTDHHTYAGEVPWCDMYSTNGWEDWSFGSEWGDILLPKKQTFRILVPVRDNHWEESYSAVIPYRAITLPSREIAENLCLCGQPQSFDLFEKENGRCAAITFQYGGRLKNSQDFTYLRRDLLERYLEEINGKLIWAIWGERLQISQNTDENSENTDAQCELFQAVKTYQDIMKPSFK